MGTGILLPLWWREKWSLSMTLCGWCSRLQLVFILSFMLLRFVSVSIELYCGNCFNHIYIWQFFVLVLSKALEVFHSYFFLRNFIINPSVLLVFQISVFIQLRYPDLLLQHIYDVSSINSFSCTSCYFLLRQNSFVYFYWNIPNNPADHKDHFLVGHIAELTNFCIWISYLSCIPFINSELGILELHKTKED